MRAMQEQLMSFKWIFVLIISLIISSNVHANTIATSKSLQFGVDSIDVLSANETTIYYSFTLSSPSGVILKFNHADVGNNGNSWKVYIESSNGLNEYLYIANQSRTTSETKSVGLPAGTYLVRVSKGDGFSIGNNFTLNVSIAQGSWEQEYNNSVVTATPITLGISYKGSLQNLTDITPASKDDYYQFTLLSPSGVSVKLEHADVGNNGNSWKVYIESSNGLNEYLYIANQSRTTSETKSVGLPAGTYLVRVSQGSDSFSVGNDYTLTASIAQGSWEQEYNNSVVTATPITLGISYKGSLQNVTDITPASKDDCYQFTLLSPSNVSVKFEHADVGNNGKSWIVYVLSSNGQIQHLDMNNLSRTTSQTASIGLPAGTYIVQVRQGSDTFCVGNDYALTVSAVSTAFFVTPSAGSNGTISPATTQAVNNGSTATFTITANSNYRVITPIGGTCPQGTYNSVGTTNNYTTGAITANCSVSPSFAPIVYSVTPTTGANGSISPAAPVTVNINSTATFTFTPNNGYTVVTPVGGTCPQGLYHPELTTNNYITGSITGNCTITPTFIANEMNLTVTSSGTGSGTVTSNSTRSGIPNDITCDAGPCNATYPYGSTVSISALAGSTSLFGGWSGDCVASPCNILMNGSKSVNAVFNLAPYAKNISTDTSYTSLDAAVLNALPGNTILALDIQHGTTISFDKGITLTGGFSPSYLSQSGGYSVLIGDLTVVSGDSAIETFVVHGKVLIQSGVLRVNGVKVY